MVLVRASCLLLIVGGATNLQSQTRQSSVFDQGFGAGQRLGGEADLAGFSIFATTLLSRALRETSSGAFIGAINLTAYLTVQQEGDYVTVPLRPGFPTDPQECIVNANSIVIAALGGWSNPADQKTGSRILGGPAYFRTACGGKLGATVRLDGAQQLSKRTSYIFWLEGFLQPRSQGERRRVLAAGIGLRGH
jgi:hypothetical protein